jgi:Fungal specific transcription factor domain/Fungal Zn(2)-Cys(6) binuclear cluster domain
VKCGEEKPICFRCIRVGLDCDGYTESTESSRPGTPPSSKSRLLLPKVDSSTATAPPVSGGLPCGTPIKKIRIPPNQVSFSFPSASRFKSPQEYRFHQLFCSKVAKELSGFLPTNLWHQSVLQAAEAEPFLFDAVVAVGALHKIITDAPDLKDAEAHRRSNEEHNFALERYHKALGCMRKALSEGKMETRTALIACLLTICFDNFYGSRHTALLSMQSGVNLARQISRPRTSCTPSRLNSAEVKTNATSTGIEGELVAIFTRLDITSMSFIDLRSPDEHRIMKDSLYQATETRPNEYSELEEAVCDGEMILARCWHFIKIVQETHQKHQSLFDCFAMTEQCRWIRLSIRYGWNPWTGSDEAVPDSWLAEFERCICEIERWLSAFGSLVPKFQSSTTKASKLQLRATLISLQAKFTLLSVRGAVHKWEREWDAHLSDFHEIVALAEEFLASRPKRFYASFESDTLIILAYLICKCRDGELRRRALKLLDDYPRREAIWDSRYCSKLGHWIMDIEEGGRGALKSHEITEEQRCRLFALDYNSVEGTMRTWACQTTPNGETVNHDFRWN